MSCLTTVRRLPDHQNLRSRKRVNNKITSRLKGFSLIDDKPVVLVACSTSTQSSCSTHSRVALAIEQVDVGCNSFGFQASHGETQSDDRSVVVLLKPKVIPSQRRKLPARKMKFSRTAVAATAAPVARWFCADVCCHASIDVRDLNFPCREPEAVERKQHFKH